MGSCICMNKSDLIFENDDVVTALRHTPYRWAVINPRPSVSRLILRQQQDQSKRYALHQDVPYSELYESFNICSQESHYPLTCLEVLDSISVKSDTSLEVVQQEQEEEVKSTDNSIAGIPRQLGSPGSWKNRSILEADDNEDIREE